jgi:porin
VGVTATGVPISLASPLSVGPLNHQGDWGIYGLFDQMVWRAGKGPQSVNVFLRGGASPSDRNLVVGSMRCSSATPPAWP